MKKIIILFFIVVLIVIIGGCSKEEISNTWVVEDFAGIENPGFTISNKVETKDEIVLELEDIDIDLVEQFIDNLYSNPDFILDVNYNYDTDSYSYGAFNDKRESIHFTYSVENRTGSFTYAKSGIHLFNPGVRDMGYSVNVDYDYASNDDYTEYIASLFYGIGLNIKFTDSTEQLVSFVLKDFQFTSLSTFGVLSFRESVYEGPIENYTKTGSNIYDLNFYVVQKNIGQYSVETPYGETSTFFDIMGIEQSDIYFEVAFTLDITTNLGDYSYVYEINVMPDGTDVTQMDRYMRVENYRYTIDKGIPFDKLD